MASSLAFSLGLFAVNTWSYTTCALSSLSVVEWVMKAEGVSKKHAVELLKSDFSASPSTPKRGRQKGVVPMHATTRKLDAPFGPDEPDEVLLRRVVGFYNETLKSSPEAMAFLQKRGVTSGEVIERFTLGYANRTLAYRLPAKSRKAGAELLDRLQRLGVLRESGHERMNGSVVIPLFDADGRIVNIYGRKGSQGHAQPPARHRAAHVARRDTERSVQSERLRVLEDDDHRRLDSG